MSRVNKLKKIKREDDADDFSLPTEKQKVVKIISSKGNNLHEVEDGSELENHYLVTMPNKFRNNVWIKRGDFVLVEEIREGDKVKAEIVRILTVQHQKEYAKHGFMWPKKFTKKRDIENLSGDEVEIKGCRNQNRRESPIASCATSSSESD